VETATAGQTMVWSPQENQTDVFERGRHGKLLGYVFARIGGFFGIKGGNNAPSRTIT